MITCNLFLTTHYLIDYFFINKIFFIKARNSEWAYTTGISTSNKAFMHQTGTEIKLEKKLNPCFSLQLNSLAILIKMVTTT